MLAGVEACPKRPAPAQIAPVHQVTSAQVAVDGPLSAISAGRNTPLHLKREMTRKNSYETDVDGVADSGRYSAQQRRAQCNICVRYQSPRGTERDPMRGVSDDVCRMGR